MLSFVMAGVIRVSTLQSCQKWPPATPIANRLHGKIRLHSEFCKRLWGAIVVTLTAIGFLTLFFGLIVLMPLIGHASWHAYRDLVE